MKMKKRRVLFVIVLTALFMVLPPVTTYAASKYIRQIERSYGEGSDRTDLMFVGTIIPGYLWLNDRAEVGAAVDAFSPNELRYARIFAFVYGKTGACVTTWSYSNMGVWDSYSLGAPMSVTGGSSYKKMKMYCDVVENNPWTFALERWTIEVEKP